MASLAALLAVAAFVMLACAWQASAAETSGASAPGWRFAPASAPPPPAGVTATGYPVPLGQVGDIEFWTPNRGLLITGGTGSSCAATAGATVPCGLYAYDGRTWHQLSTVCGGANGRIAWAGPGEFWTISDQRPGQVVVTGAEYAKVSLCHFQNGQVVASYALPLNQPNSYLPMNAAACLSPSNCWFGGELGQSPNFGAFHLHWDGHNMTVVYSPEDHAVTSMALASPSILLESVALAPEDIYSAESTSNPFVLHQIDPSGSSIDFHNLFLSDSACATGEFCPPLPNYGIDASGNAVEPDTLGPFSLSSDFTPSASNQAPPQLWAVAGPNGSEPTSSSAGVAHPIALRYFEGIWSQVVGGSDPGGNDPFQAGEVPQGVAAEPGTAAAWVTIHSDDNQAHVTRITAQGTPSEQDVLGEAQQVGQRGNAGPIACPAANDCWLATEQGWLFHLTDGATSEQDTDPNFAGVITFRPSDGGVPQLPADEPPPDNSLANQAPPPPPLPPPVVQPPSLTRKPLVTGVRSHVHHYTLELSFRLTVKARVQLLASHGGRHVAQTRRETLKAGVHTLRLLLNPRMWPNKLDLKAIPLEVLPTVSSPSSGEGGAPTSGSSNANNLST